MAWSDRMVSMYSSILFFAWLWYPLRKKIKVLPFWGFGLLITPMGLDGGTHLISDLAGISHGFRDTNMWLASITQSAFPESFYFGDALGSFNSWMRFLSGTLFGMGTVWFGFPYLDESFKLTARMIDGRLNKLEALKEKFEKDITAL